MHGFKELSETLRHNFELSKFRLDCLTCLILGLFVFQSTNLKKLCFAGNTGAKPDSCYRRFQRFFSEFSFSSEQLAVFFMNLFFDAEDEFYLAIDRTNWKYGESNINILVVALVYRGIAIPLHWHLLDKRGNSNTSERIALLDELLEVVDVRRIAGILGDREFIGKEWFEYLQKCGIPFVMRIKDNTKVQNKGKDVHVKQLFADLRVGQKRVLKKARSIWSLDGVYLSATRSSEGELVIVATMDKELDALKLYGHRWEIETLFSCLKGRGFNFEDTRIVDQDRIKTMMGVLSIAFVWAHKTGEWVHENVKKLVFKNHGRLSKSFFRQGLDLLKTIFISTRYSGEVLEFSLSLLGAVATATNIERDLIPV